MSAASQLVAPAAAALPEANTTGRFSAGVHYDKAYAPATCAATRTPHPTRDIDAIHAAARIGALRR